MNISKIRKDLEDPVLDSSSNEDDKITHIPNISNISIDPFIYQPWYLFLFSQF